MAYMIMAYIVMAYIVTADIVVASIVMACIVIADIVMAYIGMAYVVVASIDIALSSYYLRSETEFAGALQIPIFFEKSIKRCGIVLFEVRAFQRYVVCLVWTMSH